MPKAHPGTANWYGTILAKLYTGCVNHSLNNVCSRPCIRARRNAERNRGQARLLAILGLLPFRIPACLAPILLWNVLNIWTRSTKAWGLLLSGLMAATTASCWSSIPFFMLPDPDFVPWLKRSISVAKR